jgi:predicted N-formylglutamate amidohydrolase
MITAEPTLLGVDEPPPFELVNGAGQGKLLLVCDHASNRIPARLGNLGLTQQQLATHIGWDLGAAAVARRLAALLDAPLLLANYSRLVIDCNRWPSNPASIVESSDGIAVPGNAGLSPAEALARRRALFDPYHTAIAEFLSQQPKESRFLLSIHSFTPSLAGVDRHWPIGVCYRTDISWGKRWLDVLKNKLSEPVGNNQPYDVEADIDFTIPVQAEARAIPGIMLEIRDDRIIDEAGIEACSEIVAESWLELQGTCANRPDSTRSD